MGRCTLVAPVTDEKPPKSKLAKAFETIDKLIAESGGKLRYGPEEPERSAITVFACGPPTDHKCDHEGPEAKIMSECRLCGGTGTCSPHGGVLNCPKCKGTGQRESGSSSSWSVCGMSAFDRSWWEGP